MQLRSYQNWCCDRIMQKLTVEGSRSTLVVLPTGCGKTIVFASIADAWEQGRVLVLAHREELIFQAFEKIKAVTGQVPEIEMADMKASSGSGFLGQSKFVVASVQSICQPSRLERFSPSDFGLVIVDEAHHCVLANKTYGRIVRHFQQNAELRILGVTATPDRADEEALGQVFDSVAFEYGIAEAIHDGWLVPIDQQFAVVEALDFSKVRTTAGDLNEGDLEAVVMEEGPLHKVVDSTIQYAGKEPTLVFAVSVAHARAMADIFNRHAKLEGTGQAVCLHGETPREVRRETLREYAERRFQFLVGCGLFLEGFDAPAISVVSMARPTKSRSLYAQAVGRGTRTLPGVVDGVESAAERVQAIATSGKPRLLVLDFVGNSGRHKLVTCADILGGNYSEAIIEDAVEAMRRGGGPRRVLDELGNAEERETEAKRKAEEAKRRREEAEARRRAERQAVVGKAVVRTESVDPFGHDSLPERGAGFEKHGDMATEKQVEWLRDQGINAVGWTKAQAGKRIGELMDRYRLGGCTEKQAKKLREFGENPDGMSRNKASALLDLIAARGWKPIPYDLTRDRWSLRPNGDGSWSVLVKDDHAGKVTLGRKFSSEADARSFVAGCLETPAGEMAA